MEPGINTNCSIHTYINKQRTKPNGTSRLYIRISIKGGESKKIPLPLYWSAAHFDSKLDAITPREKDDPDYLTFHSVIETEKAKYWNVIKRLLLKGVRFTMKDIVTGVKLGSNGQFLCTWMLHKILERQREKEIKDNSAKNHKCSALYILKYRQEDVNIADIDSKWLNKYTVWLLRRMQYAGAWSRVKDIKTYIKLAEESGTAIHDDFKNHYLPPPEHDPVFLDRDEVDLLFAFYKDQNTSPELRACLRIFLFDCFTGLRISDLRRFERSWIQKDEIVFKPTKGRITSNKEHIVKIPIIGMAKDFLMTLGDKNLMTMSDAHYNRSLKSIAALTGIKKNITAHVARHTFATSLAILNVPVIVISKLLGHKTIVSTMIYIHIAENIRKKEMDKLQEAFSGYTLKETLALAPASA